MNKKSKLFKDLKSNVSGKPLDLMEVQDILTEMMKALHDFCEKHEIRYTLAYGSLLGAVRHKGFIPWDDDMDVYMPRPDYEKFISFPEVSDRFKIVTYTNDHGYYHPYAYAVLADTETLMIENDTRCPTGKGQFLDVFPVDGISDDPVQCKKHFNKLMFYGYLKGLQSYDYKKMKISSFKDLCKACCALLLTPLDEMKIVRKQDVAAQKYDYESSEYSAQLIAGRDREKGRYRKDYFEERILVPFGKYQFYISKDWDEDLKMNYGNYMELPPESERLGHHFVDLYYRNK